MWRNDFEPEHSPAVDSVVRYATDLIVVGEDFILFVEHVYCLRGRGFMFRVEGMTSGKETGNVILGTSPAEYDAAVKAGREAFATKVAELEESVRQLTELIS